MKNELPGRDDLPPGCTLRDIDPPPRPWLDDEPDAREPERLRCRSCGGIWDEPKLNADGVCPDCVLELNER